VDDRRAAVEHQNVTLSLPADVVREARHLAVDRGLSLSRFLASILEEQTARARAYRRAQDRALRRMRDGVDLGTNGTITWTRDELHER
jgi:hypothetical protein